MRGSRKNWIKKRGGMRERKKVELEGLGLGLGAEPRSNHFTPAQFVHYFIHSIVLR